VEVNRKLAYQAYKGGKMIIIYDGEDIGTQYETARGPIDLRGRLAYAAARDGEWFAVIE
jgi:hypothetical protein